jgi:hypothetical protein
MKSFIHPEKKTPEGEPLAIDVACFGDAKAARQALFISGTHGQEGFSGSAVQIGWMQTDGTVGLARRTSASCWCTASIPTASRISRAPPRTTSTSTATSSIATQARAGQPALRDLHDELRSATGPTRRMRGSTSDGAFTEKHGRDALFDTLARGQYAHPDGLMFGGRTANGRTGRSKPSCRNS